MKKLYHIAKIQFSSFWTFALMFVRISVLSMCVLMIRETYIRNVCRPEVCIRVKILSLEICITIQNFYHVGTCMNIHIFFKLTHEVLFPRPLAVLPQKFVVNSQIFK